jgi:RNA polymerase sigma-70 factor (ECF subfamily)
MGMTFLARAGGRKTTNPGRKSIQDSVEDSAKVVAALQAGDRKALERLYIAHRPGLFVYVNRMVSDRAVAEEIVQDLFIRVWRCRQELELRGTLRSYLYAAGRNHAINHLKRRKVAHRWWQRKSEILTQGSPVQQGDSAAYRELSESVESAIAALPERTRLVFTLSRNGGLTYPEIAKEMGISVKTVESQMARALRYLRESLKPFLEDHHFG